MSSWSIRFSGNGGRSLQPFRVPGNSTMYWTNGGRSFQIFNHASSRNGTVISTAKRGTTFVPPGRYRLQIYAIGKWSIVIRSGTEPVRRVGGAIVFSGNGGKALPPFRVRRDSRLYWTNSGQIFEIFNSGPSRNSRVNSQARRGSTRLSVASYRLQVNAIGNWTIRIR